VLIIGVMSVAAPRTPHLADTSTTTDTVEYNLPVKAMAGKDRPREKLLAAGPQNLTQAELVAILWGVGTRKEDVLT
jgi:hypothetical protein